MFPILHQLYPFVETFPLEPLPRQESLVRISPPFCLVVACSSSLNYDLL